MNLNKITGKLKEQGWWMEESFYENNIGFLQALVNETKEQQLLINKDNDSLLIKFMEHTFNCSGCNYVSDIDQPWSGVNFTKKETQILEKIQESINPEQ